MAMVAVLHVSAVRQMLSLPSSGRVSFNAQRSDCQEEDNSYEGRSDFKRKSWAGTHWLNVGVRAV